MSVRRLATALLSGALVGVLAGPASTSAPGSAGQASRAGAGSERIHQDFDRPASRAGLRPTGPGRWRVAGGRLRLTGAERATAPARVPMAVHRRAVRGAAWDLRATMWPEGRSGNASVVVGWLGREDYVEVHVERSRARSGVYAVRAGARTLLAPLRMTARPGARHSVRARYRDGTLAVRVRRPGARDATSTSLVLPGSTRVGFGSRGGSASFDDLRVIEQRPGRAVAVATSAELVVALDDARPGDVITLADGTYTTDGIEAALDVGGKRYYGTFVVSRSGTAEAPVVVQGGRSAIIDGAPGSDGTSTQYGLYLAGVEHVQVRGITVRNVSKGIVLDRSARTTISSVLVEDVGQEGIHLRATTHHSEVSDSVVRRTGLDNASFGEGIYVGSATSNWGTYSDGRPDASDHNRILRNTITETGAESVDIKEGTSHGILAGNVFDGAGMTGSFADSWVDVKGNAWTVTANRGTTALEDGFQVHGILEGWGLDNVFAGNVADVRGRGYGFWVQDNVTGNRVACDNVVTAAASGFTNAGPCRPIG